jgi:3-oxoacyl-[acyl-carrier protein] reductase
MELGLDGKVALVTAASKGIGRAIVHRLAQEGARVAMSSSSAVRLAEALTAMKDVTRNIHAHPADLSDPDATAALVDGIVSDYGRLDIAVINTPGPRIVPFIETTVGDWAKAYDVLVRPAVQLALASARQMIKQQSGSIVFMTSTWVKQTAAGGILSSSMRSAVSAMSKQMALELAPHNIRVNQIMPGATGTDRMKTIIAAKTRASGRSEDEELRNVVRDLPLGRWAKPDEIANAVAFVVSPMCDFLTGVALQIDGGAVRSTL